MGTKSLTLQYDLHRIDGEERVLCATGKVTCAITDLQAFRAVALPDDLAELFLELSESAS
jgi:acyl-CoA thioesterase FadM